jgi:hypothetical protein
MAQEPPAIHCEDIPLAEARTMGRGPRFFTVTVSLLCAELFSKRGVELSYPGQIECEGCAPTLACQPCRSG